MCHRLQWTPERTAVQNNIAPGTRGRNNMLTLFSLPVIRIATSCYKLTNSGEKKLFATTTFLHRESWRGKTLIVSTIFLNIHSFRIQTHCQAVTFMQRVISSQQSRYIFLFYSLLVRTFISKALMAIIWFLWCKLLYRFECKF